MRAFEKADALRQEVERRRDRTQAPAQLQALMILNGQVAALHSSASAGHSSSGEASVNGWCGHPS
ncbi:hypothetical protein [Streptomyces sp. SD15]